MQDVIHSQFAVFDSASDEMACEAAKQLVKVFKDNERLSDLIDYITGETEDLLSAGSVDYDPQILVEAKSESKKSKAILGMRTTKSGE